MDMDKYCGSVFWDINIYETQYPNFTSCFRNTILIWIPCIFLWILSPLEMYYIFTSKSRNIPFNVLNTLKMVLITLTASIDLIEITSVFWDHKPSIYLHNAILQFITFVLCLMLTWGNMKKGIRSSGILFCFSLISVLCSLPQLMHFITPVSKGFEIKVNPVMYFIYAMSIGLILVLNCFPDPQPLYSVCVKGDKYCPKHEASFISKLFVLWFGQYILQNYKEPTEENLWNLDYEDSAEYLVHRFKKPINDFLAKNKPSEGENCKKNKVSIFTLLMKTCGFEYFKMHVWRLLIMIIFFTYSILLGIIITSLKEKKPSWILYICAISLILVSSLENLVNVQYITSFSRMTVRVHSVLMSTIYKKVLRITDRTKQIYPSGEMVALISADVENIPSMLDYSVLVSMLPLSIGILSYYIWKLFGPGSLITFAVFILCMPLQKYFYDKVTKLSHEEIKHRNTRGRFLHDLLAGIKVLKMYAWESNFLKKACLLREEEYKNFKKIGLNYNIMLVVFNSLPLLMSSITFAAHLYLDDESFGLAQAFVAITLYNNFQKEMTCICKFLNCLVQGYISLKKIEKFARQPELDDEIVSHDVTDEALIIKEGTFSWISSEEEPVLKNLNLKISKGALVSVTGSVGSGKSSLISAFLGHLFKITGYVNVNGKTAYVPQQAWILNTSFKENITLNKTIEDSTYKKILDACALNEDLQSFPAGDMTEIGEKGINLSGGQKQRINLARAICCNADIYFLDDALSAVDITVSKHIFDEVFGPRGLLKNKTRVLVTHNTSFLPQSDLIFFLQNGYIEESGTFHEMTTSTGHFSEYLINYSKFSQQIQPVLPDNTEYSNFSAEFVRKNMKTQARENKESTDENKLIKKEHVERGEVKKEVYAFLINQIGIGVLMKVIGLNILHQILSICSRLWLMLWAVANENDSDENTQQYYLAIYIGLGILDGFLSFATNFCLMDEIFKTSAIIYDKLIEAVLQWPQWLLDSTPVGRIMNRATLDSYCIDVVIAKMVIEVLGHLNQYIFVILLVFYVFPLGMIFIIIGIVLLYVVKELYKKSAFQLHRINASNKSLLSSFMVETLQGLHSIRANGYQDIFTARSYEMIDLYSTATFAIEVCKRWLAIRTNFILTGTTCLILLCIFRQRENMEIGLISVTISYMLEAYFYCEWGFIFYTYVETGLISVERIKEFIDSPREKYKSSYEIANLGSWPYRGEIKFLDYKLRYRKQDELVLKGLTFTVKSGDKIGIVGRTGAGKSSMITGVLRIVEPGSGTILIDNIDITQIDLEILRSRLTLIPQDPILFLGTLRFNLDPSGTYSDEKLWNALEKAHLKDYIQQLPQGLDYLVEEGGANMSCGQRQLLCLARALLRKTKVILMDEATASVDLETDKLIQNTIRNEFSECTVLTIAHRLNTIQDYDRILVLDDGSIIEYDTPDTLINSKNSTFYNIMLESGLISE